MSLQPVTVPATKQETLLYLYDLHGPKLWGLIVKANLPQRQSEAVLLNAFVNAFKQIHEQQITEKEFFTALLRSALAEGLSLTCLQPIFSR